MKTILAIALLVAMLAMPSAVAGPGLDNNPAMEMAEFYGMVFPGIADLPGVFRK